MSEHYVITADHAHLRIFIEQPEPGRSLPELEEIQAMDFPPEVTETRTDAEEGAKKAGFQDSGEGLPARGSPAARTRRASDEQIFVWRERRRRQVNDLTEAIDAFFLARPKATWDFAAAPAVHNAVLEALSRHARGRLRQALPKDLMHQRTQDLRAHFAVR